jgi:hypothetical protein
MDPVAGRLQGHLARVRAWSTRPYASIALRLARLTK